MKQTAVDFAVEQLEKLIPSGNQIIIGIIIDKAKEMEKNQIMRTAWHCHIEGVRQVSKTSQEYIEYAEQYYKETYGDK
jgi:hypothetical protein